MKKQFALVLFLIMTYSFLTPVFATHKYSACSEKRDNLVTNCQTIKTSKECFRAYEAKPTGDRGWLCIWLYDKRKCWQHKRCDAHENNVKATKELIKH